MDRMGDSKQETVTRYETMIIRFYNRLGCIAVDCFEDIPLQARETLAHMDYRQIVEPLIVADLQTGLSTRYCAIKYGIGRTAARVIQEKYSINKTE